MCFRLLSGSKSLTDEQPEHHPYWAAYMRLKNTIDETVTKRIITPKECRQFNRAYWAFIWASLIRENDFKRKFAHVDLPKLMIPSWVRADSIDGNTFVRRTM
jgi:hypothetical protein